MAYAAADAAIFRIARRWLFPVAVGRFETVLPVYAGSGGGLDRPGEQRVGGGLHPLRQAAAKVVERFPVGRVGRPVAAFRRVAVEVEELFCRNPSPAAPGLSPGERRYYPRFLDLRARLLRHYAEPLCLDDSLGVERFSVLWQRFFGTTPYADLQQARINAAKRMLVTGDTGVKEIACRCGWNDAFYFSRLFRKRCGVSPREFRRRNGLGSGFFAE